jgi:lipid-A-disaccharide synthase-like uncharacterized protein
MDWLTHFLWQDIIWRDGKFLGITWTIWKVIGWTGNVVFSSRIIVQWYATEKHKKIVVPVVFWWLSLIGSLLLLTYALSKLDSVWIFANLFGWIIYSRNLIIHYRHEKAHRYCPQCKSKVPPLSNFCSNCGAQLQTTAVAP